MIAMLFNMAFRIAWFLVAAGGVMAFEYGPRPPGPVFDPGGFLDPKVAREISGPLLEIRESEGIEVIVVVVGDLTGASAGTEARRIADAWCDSAIHAVVLHVPGDPDGPWIVPAGALMGKLDPEQVTQAVAEAGRRVALEPGEPGKVRAASIEAADLLRYWMNNVINRAEILATERTRLSLELETKAHQRKVATFAGLSVVVPVLALGVLLFLRTRKPTPRHFPDMRPPRRLGAPHAGGNFAVIDLGAPLP